MAKLYFRDLEVAPHHSHLHTTQVRPNQLTSRHSHDFYEVFLVLDGSGRHFLNDLELSLQPGQLVAILPEDEHCFATGASETLVFINAVVSASWWRAFHVLTGTAAGWEKLGEPRGHCQLSMRQRLEMENALHSLGPGHEGGALALAEVWKKVAEVFQRLATDATQAEPPEWLDIWRKRVATADLPSLQEDITAWQKRSGRTPEHLARSCRRHFGVTPSTLLNKARIDRARHLLRSGNEKVTTIALDCGFQNMSHFHRIFVGQVGQTPNQWRASHSPAVPV